MKRMWICERNDSVECSHWGPTVDRNGRHLVFGYWHFGIWHWARAGTARYDFLGRNRQSPRPRLVKRQRAEPRRTVTEPTAPEGDRHWPMDRPFWYSPNAPTGPHSSSSDPPALSIYLMSVLSQHIAQAKLHLITTFDYNLAFLPLDWTLPSQSIAPAHQSIVHLSIDYLWRSPSTDCLS